MSEYVPYYTQREIKLFLVQSKLKWLNLHCLKKKYGNCIGKKGVNHLLNFGTNFRRSLNFMAFSAKKKCVYNHKMYRWRAATEVKVLDEMFARLLRWLGQFFFFRLHGLDFLLSWFFPSRSKFFDKALEYKVLYQTWMEIFCPFFLLYADFSK